MLKYPTSTSQTPVTDVKEVDREVRRVADTVRGLSNDVCVLKTSVTNLEVGQLTTECCMQALLEAHRISAEAIQDRMAAAKRALDQSQQQRYLPSSALGSLTSCSASAVAQPKAASQCGTKKETEQDDKKHPRSEDAVPRLSLSSGASWQLSDICLTMHLSRCVLSLCIS